MSGNEISTELISEVKSNPVIGNTKSFAFYDSTKGNLLENANYLTEQLQSLYYPTETQDKTYSIYKDKLGEPHPFDYTIIEQVVRKFAILSAIGDKIGDYVFGGGYSISSSDDKIIDIIDNFRNKTYFDHYIRPWFIEGLYKGSSYMEITGLDKPDIENILISIINANTVYIKKDEYGKIINYVQFIRSDKTRNFKEELIDLDVNNIIPLHINVIGHSCYGMGIVYSALPIIDNFLDAQKALHKLMSRKANSPIHVKVGDAATGDFPEQSEIDAIGKKFQYMDNSTEYVTGPNFEMKVLEFGNVSDKFTGIIDNDLKLLSYAFQVPEIILGADRGFTGSSEVQENAFERNIKSYQEQAGFIMKTKVFDKVLLANGITEPDYEIEWGSKSPTELNSEVTVLKELINAQISSGMRKELEKRLAMLYDIDYDEVEEENELKKQELQKQMQLQLPVALPSAEPINKEESINNEEEIDEDFNEEIKGIYSKNICENQIIDEGIKISEYLSNKDVSNYKDIIVDTIRKDAFSNIKAYNSRELNQGYLNANEVNKFRTILLNGVKDDMSLKEIKTLVKENVFIPELTKYGKVILNKDVRTNLIVNTETTRLLNKGLKAAYKKEGVEVVQWDATIDGVTCLECQDLNGQTFDVSTLNSSVMPPAHVNCRCSLNRIQTQEKIKDILSKNPAPQELEQVLIKNGLSEEKAKIISEKYNNLSRKVK